MGSAASASPIPSPRPVEVDRQTPLQVAKLSKRQEELVHSEFNPFLEGLVTQGLHLTGVVVVNRHNAAVLFASPRMQLHKHAFKSILRAMKDPVRCFWEEIEVNHTPYSIFFAARQSLHAKGPGGQGGLVAVRGSNTGTLTVVTFDAPSELCEVVITTGEISDFVDTTLVR